MELRHLEVFVAVAEELSFTRASSRLHLVQSGVSSAVKALERDLGAALFDRDRHRVALTHAGQALLPAARATLAAAQAARDAVGAGAGRAARDDPPWARWCPPAAWTCRLSWSDSTEPIPVSPSGSVISASGSAGLARDVVAGGLDLALLSLPGQVPAGLSLRPVTEEPLVVISPPEHPLACLRVRLAQSAGESFIDFPPGWGNRAVADRAFAAAGLDREVPFEAADFTSVIALVRAGLGIAFLPARCGRPGSATWPRSRSPTAPTALGRLGGGAHRSSAARGRPGVPRRTATGEHTAPITVSTTCYHRSGTVGPHPAVQVLWSETKQKESDMRYRTIGTTRVSAIGLGGMPMSIEGRPDEDRSIRTIHAALDAGVTLIDTADAYHLRPGETGHNERLIAEALASYGGDISEVLVATKGGHLRPGDGSWTVDGSPAHLRQAAEASLKALGVDAIGLYQFHRPDPKVPYAESIGALKELLDAGKIRMAGISNATIEQIDIARRILGEGNLASVQNQFSPAFRSSEPELAHCAGLGIAFLPYSPLGGIPSAGKLGARHAAFQQVADAHAVSPQQVTLAWMLAKAPVVIPIPGAAARVDHRLGPCRRPTLSAAELEQLDQS